MKTDFDDWLREALESAALEVTPDPSTWQRVRGRINRQRISRWLSLVLASATAVLVAVTVMPGLLRAGSVQFDPAPGAAPTSAAAPVPLATPLPTPSTEASAPPAGEAGVAPVTAGGVVALQPDGLSLRDPSGQLVAIIGLGALTDVAAAPVRTEAGAPLAWRLEDDRIQYANLRARDELVDGGTLATERAITTTGPVWAPDAGHVAWVETGMADGGDFRVHVVRWDTGGPVPGSDAVLDLDTTAALTDLRLTGWRASDGESVLLLTGRLGGERPRRQAFVVEVQVTDTGEVGVLGPLTPAEDEEAVLQSWAAAEGSLYTLAVTSSDAVTLRRTAADGAETELPLPAELDPAALTRGQPWLAADGEVLLLGDGTGRSWHVTLGPHGGPGELQPLPGEVLRAALLPVDSEQERGT